LWTKTGVPDAPLVSVIIATYNRSAVLAFTLQSLLGQTLGDFEAWVVGDACTDDSQAVVQAASDPRLNWINLPHNTGSQSGPNNEGLRRARGRYVAYLGHDDLWLPFHLAEAVAWAEATGADLVHTLCVLIGPNGRLACVGPPNRYNSYASHFAPPSSWLHRRDAVAAVGWWSSPHQVPMGVDHDYLLRFYQSGQHTSFCPRLTVLKFPSVWYRGAYAGTAPAPQPGYLEQVRAEPAALERSILQALAIAHAELVYGGDPPWRLALAQALAVLRRRALRRLGGLWPVRWLQQWRFQRIRRQLRKFRGLPADP
jgi:glycosyltransferase involved in cell wall biosynthesis